MAVSLKDNRKPGRAIVEAQIDDNLRRIFDEDAGGELPAHLKDLVARLGELDTAPAQGEHAPETDAEVDGEDRGRVSR